MILLKSGRDIPRREMSLYESKRVSDEMNNKMNNKNLCAEVHIIEGETASKNR